ncbi:zinc finger protein ZFAT isoform X2 [Genypterus blacodes]|uniref:zinc finger protein ZFAT isoform X2 n=1 Tax=Genypterus blacodes TaxID=154954 RepID=UPI003F765957
MSAGSVFMCRLCNLFSPSRSQLLAHCSQLHPQHETPDDIITALQPLAAKPMEMQTESPAKRKRGRPKGSTKKMRSSLSQANQAGSTSPENKVQKDEETIRDKGDQQTSSTEGEGNAGILGLECKKCHRSFSNKRQILKHICLREEEEQEGEEEENGVEESLDHGEANSNQAQQNPVQPGLIREKGVDGSRVQKNNRRSQVLRDGRSPAPKNGPASRNRKSVISVVLTEDKTLPGVTTMVPVEDSTVETGSAAIQDCAQPEDLQDPAASQNLTEDSVNPTTACPQNPNTDPEPNLNLATKTTAARKGFQEYSIKQDATSLLQSQLKVFTCEFCNKIFKFRHSLIAHLRTHTQEKPFQCPHCDYASAIKANLNVHLRKHTGEKFSCQHCPFNCLSPGHLKVHIERVHMKVKQHCSFCRKKYSDVKNLLKHMEQQHNLKDPAIYQNYQQLRLKTRQGLRQLLYQCPTCNRRFKNQLERERHLLVHGPQRPFACLLCDHAATKMAALAAHVRKHLFIYVCCMCRAKFVSCQSLKGHLTESHPELDQEKAFTDCINSSYYLAQEAQEDKRDEERCKEAVGSEQEETTEEGQDEKREGDTITGVREEEHKGDEGERLIAAEGEGEQTTSQDEIMDEEQRFKPQTGKEGEIEKRCTESDSQKVLHQTEKHTDRGEDEESNSPDQSEPVTREKSQDSTSDACTHGAVNIHTSIPEGTPAADKNMHNSNHTDSSSPAEMTHLPDVCVQSTPLASATPTENSQTIQSDKDSSDCPQSAFQQVISSLQKTQLNMDIFQRLRKVYGDLECQYCGKLFWYKVHYNVHVRTHTKEHLHYCSQCSYSSITKSSLKRHLIQKHSGLLLPCPKPDCKYATPDKYKLQAHLRTHQEQGKTVACPVCNQSYPEHRLKSHMKTSHPDTDLGSGKGLMTKRAEKCPYCDSYFIKNSSDFQQHIWAHQGLKPYRCSVCDYAGRSKSNLKTHMNRHSTERSHLCDLCGKKFKSKVTLKSHRLSHSEEGKQFHCLECDYTSVAKPALLRHMEQHAEFKPFRCAHCHYSCNIAGPLKRHYSKKHPDKEYQNAGPGLPNPDTLDQKGIMKCPVCEFVYGTKWELNRHLKYKHGLKLVEGSSWEVVETVEAQYYPAKDEEQQTEAAVAALQDSSNGTVNILQQIIELSSESHDAVASMVAMTPGTVTVVEQVADEQEVGSCSEQLMVVNSEESHAGDQVMVVEETDGLEALTVLTQGESTHHYIVYVQEQTVEIN